MSKETNWPLSLSSKQQSELAKFSTALHINRIKLLEKHIVDTLDRLELASNTEQDLEAFLEALLSIIEKKNKVET